MQAYPSGDRYYAQQQPPYPQQPQYYQQFPGYGYPASGGPPIAAPFPVYPGNGIQPGTPAHGRPRPLDRELSRSSTPGHLRTATKPLKSALKRNRTPDHASVGEVPLTRGRSADSTMHRQRTRSGGSRMRSSSMPRFVPDHLILTLRSTNELSVENLIDSTAAAELSESVLPIWQQGINQQSHSRGKWKVEFAGSPWSSIGLDAILAGRMIIRLYLTLARLGYSYLSTVNIANPWKTPQLVFTLSEVELEPTVFLIMISKAGDRLTILDAPSELTEQLGAGLRATFPRKIKTDRATEDGLHIFEVKRESFGVSVDKSLLVAFILRFLSNVNFQMCGSVPMGTRSILHFGQRREMWVFKYTGGPRMREYARRPSSRQSHGDHSA